jgi:hypothetical protein
MRARVNVRYVVQSVTDLEDWNAAEVVWDSDSANDLVAPGQVQEVSLDATEPRRFLRLLLSE